MLTLAQAIEKQTVEVTIDGLGYQGEGWVRLDDGWLSVRGTLPGERVVAKVEAGRRRSRRIWGTLVRVVETSPRRGDPFCSAFPACRGCQLRHVAVLDELAIKSETIAECVEKYAGISVDDQPPIETIAIRGAARADSFRVRTGLTVRRDDAGVWHVGLRADEQIINMVECPALADSTRRAVARFEEALSTFHPKFDPEIRLARIAAPVHGHGYVELEVEHDHDGYDPLIDALDKRFPPSFGIAIVDGRRKRRHIRGPTRIRLPMADLRLEVGFDDWFHATLAPAEVLYDAIEEWLEIEPHDSVLDAGCGVGTIGLICAAAGAHVVGFDINPSSVETAELNAMSNELSVRFLCGGWERVLRDLTLAGERFGTVVINPMRDPLGHRPLAYLPRLECRRVLYLGPSAAPASTDLATLIDLGFKLDRLAAVNLHPATYHVMLAALLTR